MVARRSVRWCNSPLLASLHIILFCLQFGETECSFTDDSASVHLAMDSHVWEGADQPPRSTVTPEGHRAEGSDAIIPGTLHIKEVVVHENPAGQIVLAGVLGAGVGLLGGALLSVVLGCCILKCRQGARLTFDHKHVTYRSADVIDGGV